MLWIFLDTILPTDLAGRWQRAADVRVLVLDLRGLYFISSITLVVAKLTFNELEHELIRTECEEFAHVPQIVKKKMVIRQQRADQPHHCLISRTIAD